MTHRSRIGRLVIRGVALCLVSSLLAGCMAGAAISADASGGMATKIAAARNVGLPVVMLRRPAPPGGETVATVDAVLAWLRNRFY